MMGNPLGIDPRAQSENPLLAALPSPMKRAEVLAWLQDGERRAVTDASQVKGWIEDALVVPATTLSYLCGILKMMRRSAHDQDPRTNFNRLRAIFPEYQRSRPPTPSGMCINGDTGVGKSHPTQHLLQRIPQVVEHGPIPQAEILGLQQLVHLTIQLSGDATSNAFFFNGVLAIDAALGTEYSKSPEAMGRSSKNTAMSYFIHLLKLHRLLLLVIEEGQERNLGHKGFQRILDGLVLQLMNYGIPIVLIGNPAGIDVLMSQSQAVRRLCSNGTYRIDPVLSWTDPIWVDEYMTGIWKPTPLSELDECWCSEDDLSRLVWQATAGFPGLMANLREIAICNAMERDGYRVEKQDLRAALESESYAGGRYIAEPWVKRDAALLSSRFRDTDCSYYSERWGDAMKAEDQWLRSRGSGGGRKPAGLSTDDESSHSGATPDRESGSAQRQGARTGKTPSSGSASKGKSKDSKAERSAPSATPSGSNSACRDARSPDWLDDQPKQIDLLPPVQ